MIYLFHNSGNPNFKSYASVEVFTWNMFGITYDMIIEIRSKNLRRFSSSLVMRQGRGSEATEAVFCLQAKKPLHSGSYEHA